MTTQVTAVAPANIALIKYWGMTDESQTLPTNQSLSMTLRSCVSRCTVTLLEGSAHDEVWWRTRDGGTTPAPTPVEEGVRAQLRRLRGAAGPPVRIVTGNTFPTSAGIASSASGFTALTLAVMTLIGDRPDPDRLSVLSRQSGSGSAARSAYGGYVRWPAANDDPAGPAAPIAAADHWRLCDVIAVVDDAPKTVSSCEGHRRAPTSPYFGPRLGQLPRRIQAVERALRNRDFPALAEAVEEEAIDLHLIAMSARPPIFYWQPATLTVLAAVRELRARGLDACATIDAGPNVHVLTTPADNDRVRAAIAALPGVQETIADEVGDGPYLCDTHLELTRR